MGNEIIGLSSMATKDLLVDLARRISLSHGPRVRFESGGGVEVADRVRAGADADLLVLAEAALATLADEGLVDPSTLRPLFVSEVVAAVAEGSPAPSLTTTAELDDALRSAGRVAYSTGPSGTALKRLLDQRGLTADVAGRLVQAPPGVPVGRLLASGRADLGFQQRSELMSVTGVQILGPLPGDAAITSVFSGAVLAASREPALATGVLGLMGADPVAGLVERHGMAVATPSADP